MRNWTKSAKSRSKSIKKSPKAKPKQGVPGLIGDEQPLLFYGPPPAIKAMYKATGFDKTFHPQDLLAHMREGHSRSEIVAAWGITYSNFNEWLDSFPELAEAYAVGKPAFDAYHKRTLRYSAFGMMPEVNEKSLFFMLKNQAGFVEDGGGHEYSDGGGAELEFIEDK